MPFKDLQQFLSALEAQGELRRVAVEVDPELEITEIATRVIRNGGPALLFEHVKGSPYPLAINILGSFKRIEIALGREPASVGKGLISLLERINPPSLKNLWAAKGEGLRLLRATRPRHVSAGHSQEVMGRPDLSALPVIKCWPQDGGRFITYPLVLTHSPLSRRSNLGIYRMQLHGPSTTGMHWQIQKGGGFHHAEAEALQQPLPVAAVLGGDPALMMAGVLPLPEGIEELLFAGILRGSPTPMVRAKSMDMWVPANAEFILEGEVLPSERAPEGPFGDHFGHYSARAQFPVFHLKALTSRLHPVYPAAVVGMPPQEDRYLGDAAQELLNPLVKLIRPEIEDLWAYYETGFVNLLVASVKTRYTKEPMKTALGLFGEGQLSLSKCIILVGPGINVRDFHAVLREIRQHFNAERDFLLLPRMPLDTLDFTSFTMHLGSKMVLDATPKPEHWRPPAKPEIDVATLHPAVKRARLIEDTLLVAHVAGLSREVRATLEALARLPQLAGIKLIAAVSEDVDLEDRISVLWGIFTRFDPARDVLFPEMRLVGASPVYRGPLAIEATYRQGYPPPLKMDPMIVQRVDRRWREYFPLVGELQASEL